MPPKQNEDDIKIDKWHTLKKKMFIYYDRIENVTYYHRESKYFRGGSIYCDKCTDELSHCKGCHTNIIFENDLTSYNICGQFENFSGLIVTMKTCFNCNHEYCNHEDFDEEHNDISINDIHQC